MDRVKALQPVIDYINEQDGEIDGLTPKKIWDRADVILYSENDITIFEIERHRAILGITYRPGLPMGAYITYWPRYKFDHKNNLLEDIGEVHKPEVEIDHYAVATTDMEENISFKFRKLNDEEYHCEELAFNDQLVFTNEAQLIEFATKTIKEWNYDYYHDVLSDCIDEKEIKYHIQEIKKATLELYIEKIITSWSDFKNKYE